MIAVAKVLRSRYQKYSFYLSSEKFRVFSLFFRETFYKLWATDCSRLKSIRFEKKSDFVKQHVDLLECE